ncbi:Bromodomain [Phytophthora infestans]|uniref:Bromodomain n=1 Tax=Phytophthora infestans TaxID=4787 RepID=A0A833TEG6_PHYIN|nr:Bromodomain [Phytophthora infestans]
MSSSSSSGFSDEDLEAPAPSAATPPATELSHAVELAQICSFCTTFRQPLRLPSFSRTDLQEAILGVSNGDINNVELLAELHFKLAREHPTAKMEKMVQDWEKTLARKLQENWRKEFTANPMGGGVTYAQLTVFERVKILDALCHWKLDTCAEIHKHIANLQKENDNEGIKRLRAGEIGTDDKGVSYWYFDDGCWIYAEDKPRWQLEDRKPSYMVEFASAKRIRLSINFDPDQDSTAPPLRLPVKTVAFADEVKEEKMEKVKIIQNLSDSKVKSEDISAETVKVQASVELAKTESEESMSVSMAKEVPITTHGTNAAVKEESSPIVQSPPARRMDINALCASVSPLSENAVPHQSNGSARKQDADYVSKAEGVATVSITSEASRSLSKAQEDVSLSHKSDKSTALNEKDGSIAKSSGKESPVKSNEDNAGDHTHPSVVAAVGSKKRTIIDDDSSDSSSSDVDTSTEKKAASSPPPRKKRRASIENANSAPALSSETSRDESMKPVNTQLNGTTTSLESVGDIVATETSPVEAIPDNESTMSKEVSSASSKTDTKAKESSTSTTAPKDTSSEETDAKKPEETASQVSASGAASASPTDPTAAPELFDITCESCKKCYDMRYVDPPLVERPTEEWRCFECLVNDARGWPRRRKSTPREPFSPRDEDSSSRRRSSSTKSRSGSSSSKKSRKSSSKSRSSSSSKKKSSHSSSSKRKSSSSKSSSGKKLSSSSSKKHKKRKSSSSSHHSSHGHHRRRHHYHHAEFAKLVTLFRERQEQRLGIEEARINGDLQMAFDEAPQGWRVVSSTLENLRALIESLSGGSLEQDRLRGRLILIMKEQEKQEEQRRKQQELAWNILPRRQSSRIAIGRMKNQSTQESDAEDRYSDDDVESRRPGLRSRRSPDGDGKQKHDRAWRARRRRQGSDDEDIDDEDDEMDSNGGNWIDWSLLKGNTHALSIVCLALINRLLKEEAADIFSKPVDPELDGCPNYLSVITHPMDLGTIRSRVEAKFYRKWKLFKKDVELVWQNCRTFNAPDTLVVQFADMLSKLSRSMCITAEKKGADRMKDKRSDGEESNNDSDDIVSDASKTESANKAWTESSASESSDSSNDGSSSNRDSDSEAGGRKQRPSRSSSKKLHTRSRPTKPSRTRNKRSSRSTPSRSSRKRPAPTSSSEDESSASGDEVSSPVRKNHRPARGSTTKAKGKTDPPTEDEDFSADEKANTRPPPPQNGAPSPSPPPPPPPQVAQKRPKPRLIINDSSSSDSSDSDGNSSSSSSSDSEASDSDTRPAIKQPQPPAEAPAPPPPSPPPPVASPEDSKPPERSSPKPKTSATQGKKTKAPDASSGYTTHSPALLNSYLSPTSSSSSDFSSGDSESSDGDSDSD